MKQGNNTSDTSCCSFEHLKSSTITHINVNKVVRTPLIFTSHLYRAQRTAHIRVSFDAHFNGSIPLGTSRDIKQRVSQVVQPDRLSGTTGCNMPLLSCELYVTGE